MSQFIAYTYQFSPIIDSQMNLFEGIPNYEQIMHNKQTIFEEIITNPNIQFKSRNKRFTHQIIVHNNSVLVMKIANLKFVKLEKDFHRHKMENNPSCYVIIDNRNDKQQIYIEENNSFSDTGVVCKILKNSLEHYLELHHLHIEINKQFLQQEFWNAIQNYPSGITMVRFYFSYPNLPNVSRSIGELISNASKTTNSKQTTFEFSTKEDTLTLDSNSEMLNGFVEASAKSGHPIIMKAKGIHYHIRTGNTSKKITIDNLDVLLEDNLLSSGVDKLIKLLDNQEL